MKYHLKNLLAAALVATSALTGVAHATDVATMPNQANGLIVLTDEVGNCMNGRRMYITSGYGQVLSGGCWTSKDPWVFVQYYGESEVRRYPEDNFRLTVEGASIAHKAGVL